MSRIVCAASAVVGVGILACVTHAAIAASGGYATTAAPLLIALSCGLAIGAAVTGMAWGQKRHTLAIMLVVALGAGEAYALLNTAERTLSYREAQQAPIRGALAKRAKAENVVRDAEQALQEIGSTPRLAAASEAKRTADRGAIEKAAEPGCARNCRALLEQQVNAAAAELEAARHEVEDSRRTAQQRVADARQTLEAIPMPASPTPLADKLGVEAWRIDLLAAGLASVAANGLAALLIAFGAHRGGPSTEAAAPIDVASTQRNIVAEADHFARTMFRPAERGHVRVRDIRPAYHRWCDDLGREPLPDTEIAAALVELFSNVGLQRVKAGASAEVVGITWSAMGTDTLGQSSTADQSQILS